MWDEVEIGLIMAFIVLELNCKVFSILFVFLSVSRPFPQGVFQFWLLFSVLRLSHTT